MVIFGQAVYYKRIFLHAQSFMISIDASLTNESIVTFKIENEHVACPFSEDSRRRMKEREREETGKRLALFRLMENCQHTSMPAIITKCTVETDSTVATACL